MARWSRVTEAAEVVLSPGGRRAMIGWKPFSVTSFRMMRLLSLQGLRPRTIIDGGANIGQFSRAAAETFSDARIVAFEPLPEVVDRLRTNLADCPRVEIHSVALGPRDGTVAFHANRYSPASSVLAMTHEAHHSFRELSERDVVEVPVARLDSVLEGAALEPPVLLKLDLQGYELEALRGAKQLLPRIRYVLLETSFWATYEGEPLFDDVYSFMVSSGFRFLCPVDVLRDAHGRIAQFDALFEAVVGPRAPAMG